MDKNEVENLAKQFLQVQTIRQLSNCLKVEYKVLTYYLYKVPDEIKYGEFEIKKRNGGSRKIVAPNSGLKFIQSNLNFLLQHIYPPKSNVHGFILERSIKTNAEVHLQKKILVNVDLENFFPSINFGRVRGLFSAYPFNFNLEVATALAQICCYKGALPQGAPTSPIVSNFICRRLDNELLDLAYANKVKYTRYADDITISTNLKKLPRKIGVIKNSKFEPSPQLNKIITSNDFAINQGKTRYALRNNRQEVTGLIVNEKINVNRKYIRHVRAMIHSWEKFGITLAATEHFSKYNFRHKKITNPENSFKNELVGKVGFIGFIRGKDDSIYSKLLSRLGPLAPEVNLTIVQNEIEQEKNPIVFGEGKTDWKHLKKAFESLKKQGFYRDVFLKFREYTPELRMSNTQLLDICESLSKAGVSNKKVICLFDRDDPGINRQITENGQLFKNWGHNVYSLLMPIPPNRKFDRVCIEHYYSDDELRTTDKNGRRLYLSNEFDKTTGKHLTDPVRFKILKALKANYPKILDSNVLDVNDKNVALSKMAFSEYVLEGTPPFDNISFDNFKALFDEIEKIILATKV